MGELKCKLQYFITFPVRKKETEKGRALPVCIALLVRCVLDLTAAQPVTALELAHLPIPPLQQEHSSEDTRLFLLFISANAQYSYLVLYTILSFLSCLF